MTWKSYLLRPSPEPRTMEKFTAYTQSWGRPNDTEPGITFTTWSGEHDPPSHSLPPAIGNKVAATFGPQEWDRFHLGLMRAYFTDNRTVSDLAVMRSVAVEAGIDGDDFESRFTAQADALAAVVIQDHNDAIEVGVTGVPCVVINDTFPVMGAQDLDFYRRIIDNITAREATEEPGASDAG